MSNVVTLPVWKKDAPPHERLYELAELAREKPHLFAKWVCTYAECTDEVFKVYSICGTGTRTSDALAVLQAGILNLWEDARR